MSDSFIENTYREVINSSKKNSGNVIKKNEIHHAGSTKIEYHDEHDDGVRVLLKKDENDQVKEIKFVCSCGETKTISLDYNE
ncbi:MAG: hypothetical protein QY331_02795 [Melioribacteraceae bacterium]|jgi:hypothetical protein|nr:hypothetical protein [Melioribacteraceae bacterium]RJP56715.1 MAG: hypothetical protein C4543_10875 [Ignavibacteriales bacterium]WKZ70183.1 MAG: hypothetical protein QY331_02795 [Melioribacteraceae bacterium]